MNIYHCSPACCCRCFVCCCPCRCACPCPVTASFTVTKRDSLSGEPLARAVYGLYQNGQLIMPRASGLAGDLTFSGVTPGQYELKEITAPPGYQQMSGSLSVVVAQDGTVTIDGQPSAGFILYDTPLSGLLFRKTDAQSALPLAGATFTLSNGQSATSDSQGTVNFGPIAPGIYDMTETAAPTGYEPNSHIYRVNAASTGAITIDGVALSAFSVQNTPLSLQSPPPGVDRIIEGAAAVSGTGIAGATIYIVWPNGITTTTTVNAGGIWTIPVQQPLPADSFITAYQQEIGFAKSTPVLRVVEPSA